MVFGTCKEPDLLYIIIPLSRRNCSDIMKNWRFHVVSTHPHTPVSIGKSLRLFGCMKQLPEILTY